MQSPAMGITTAMRMEIFQSRVQAKASSPSKRSHKSGPNRFLLTGFWYIRHHEIIIIIIIITIMMKIRHHLSFMESFIVSSITYHHSSPSPSTSSRHWGRQGHRNSSWEIHQPFSNPIAEKMGILNQLRCQFTGMVKIMPTGSLHQNLLEILTSSCNHLTISCMNCHIATTSSSTKNHQG